jgi:hypothetical protein
MYERERGFMYTYTGRIRNPSFTMQLMYGKSLKSSQVGIRSPQTRSSSTCALSCTQGFLARYKISVSVILDVVSEAASWKTAK